MSVYFLGVETFQSKSLGSLQMFYVTWPGGQVSQNWEWIGANGTVDGGTWAWQKDSSGKPCVELNSNLYKIIVARLFSPDWKGPLFPPNQPWFKPNNDPLADWDNPLEYYGTDGTKNLSAYWHVRN